MFIKVAHHVLAQALDGIGEVQVPATGSTVDRQLLGPRQHAFGEVGRQDQFGRFASTGIACTATFTRLVRRAVRYSLSGLALALAPLARLHPGWRGGGRRYRRFGRGL